MGGGPAKDQLVCIVHEPEPTEILSHLRQRFPQTEITYYKVPFTFDLDKIAAALPANVWDDVTILCTFGGFPKKLSQAPKLEFVQLLSAGSNQIQKNEIYTDSEIPIATATGVHGPQIAEWVVMTALVQSHHYRTFWERQKKHEWERSREADAVVDRVGTRVGILGYGSIGRQVGRVAKAMGMEVVAYTASKKDTSEKRKDGGFIVPGTGDPEGEVPSEWYSGLDKESLRHFLKQDLDWIVVSVPLTDETKGFLSTEEFKALSQDGKRKPYVTNIARGPIIDQPALVKALKDGVLGGAALDVTDPEPLPKESELWDLENVIITPHVSGSAKSYNQRSYQVLETNMARREKGEGLLNLVRRDRGY